MPTSDEALLEAQSDLGYHQLRVLLLLDAVCRTKGHARKLDGLTKLAKLDFLVRYPALAPTVLDAVSPKDPRLALTAMDIEAPTEVEAPMMRYRYGPWDNRYYPVLGALVGRGLAEFVKGRRGGLAVATTNRGRQIAGEAGRSKVWIDIANRCAVVAEGSTGLTGNALKELVYARLPELMDRPHREVLK